MVIDLKRCVGCQTCTVACKIENFVPPGVFFTRVNDYEVGKYPHVRRHFLPTGCMHCKEAPCVDVCPSGSSCKREDGIVLVRQELCVGCRYCMVVCPYGARHFNEDGNAGYFETGPTPYETYGAGLLGVGFGALLLLWDLGIPQRAFRLVGSKTSLISYGTIILTVLLVLAAVAIAVNLFSIGIGPTAYGVLMVFATVFALATSIYIGFLLAVVKCRPFWNTPLLPLLFVVSSASTGISALTIVGSVAGGLRVPASAAGLMASGEFLFLGLEFLMVAFYMATMENSLPQARVAVRRLVRGDLAPVFWLGVVVVGLLLPLILMAAGTVVPPSAVAVLVLGLDNK